MSTHADHAHGGHEPDEFNSPYVVWAIPFSLSMLFALVFVVILWVPSTASKEMRLKDLAGAEVSRESYLEHHEEDTEELGDIEESMEAVVRENDDR